MAPDQGKTSRIRDICRHLKPIIGPQADRIWLAYMAEDEKGRIQLEEYLELLAAKHLLGTLDHENPVLIPPPAPAAAGEYLLGHVLYDNRQLCPFGLREQEWVQHVGVFGRSGAGKTNIGFLVIQQLILKQKPVLIFDWKRNYRDLLALPGFQNMAVYTIGRPVSPFCFNPLIPPPGTNPKTWLKKLISVLAQAYLLGDGVAFLLQEAMDSVYEKAGVYSGRIEKWPTFRDVLVFLKQRNTP